jgi:hypothetical protein
MRDFLNDMAICAGQAILVTVIIITLAVCIGV